MNRCEFAYDDGAYVLGALSPTDRAAYERHLVDCPACQQSVSEIAVLPGLLGRLDPASLEQFLPPPENPRVPELLGAARDRRRRERQANRLRYAVTGLAAAAFALVVGFGVATMLPGQVPGAPVAQVRMVEMQPVAGSVPVHAEIGLKGTNWGTEVTMHCGYDERAGYGKANTFRLVAYAGDGSAEQIGSWLAAPGDDLRISGATRFTNAELVRLELIRADGTPVLAYEVR
ncbi:zf-HC2 domain-containing protein [Micromonospora sp. WMMD1082]|uniref:anti-sigma factor family protein n=1 Tax=Micromonospora sp. WMMD1082 TaxID=3016104 RepID=UPI0024168826|nr:zf-HC2 domain-containing protein [Micromonospora sp. WMMD1082]MDG4795335.1 zf-HC2 domain-containing protein [Micromonospora sp. WMMD1082]